MILNHIALVCSSEKNSDKFYQEILGLRKLESKTVPAKLAKKIFDSEHAYQLIKYGNDAILFEIFISAEQDRAAIESTRIRIEHTCIEVDSIDTFLKKCASGAVEIRRIPKGVAQLVFVTDFDDNLFEIKEKRLPT